MKRSYVFVVLVLIFVAVVLLVGKMELLGGKMNKQVIDLEGEVVRVDLGGNSLNIPMRYMYGQAVEKYNSWPKAKADRVSVDALSLSVLLPDFRPYYMEDKEKWKATGHGERLEVTVMEFKGVPEKWSHTFSLSKEVTASNAKLYTKGEDMHGLEYYAGKGGLNDILFSKDLRLQITCDPEQPPESWKGYYSPSCYAKSKYIPNINLEYYFSLKYFAEWKKIDGGVKVMFNKFLQKELVE